MIDCRVLVGGGKAAAVGGLRNRRGSAQGKAEGEVGLCSEKGLTRIVRVGGRAASGCGGRGGIGHCEGKKECRSLAPEDG